MKSLDYFETRSTRDAAGCWLWNRHLDRYGVFRDAGQLKKAHRGVSKSSISLIRLGRKWRHVAPLEAR